jgi:hypothetical protein
MRMYAFSIIQAICLAMRNPSSMYPLHFMKWMNLFESDHVKYIIDLFITLQFTLYLRSQQVSVISKSPKIFTPDPPSSHLVPLGQTSRPAFRGVRRTEAALRRAKCCVAMRSMKGSTSHVYGKSSPSMIGVTEISWFPHGLTAAPKSWWCFVMQRTLYENPS